MTLTRKRQTVFPLEWCKRVGLEKGGLLNVFDLGEAGLLVRPVGPPAAAEIRRLLAQAQAGKHSAKVAAGIVQRALRKVRRHDPFAAAQGEHTR
jgi:bifunctional DNA-binding transcriptional regulator/antitoxin component of YhaV-PrlF toxin-antitoxin module